MSECHGAILILAALVSRFLHARRGQAGTATGPPAKSSTMCQEQQHVGGLRKGPQGLLRRSEETH
eukprot:1158883-Pelagomonas_calceolata.AAC.18